jgi:two-component system phosphate regulon sensor histidine kinase PhoR
MSRGWQELLVPMMAVLLTGLIAIVASATLDGFLTRQLVIAVAVAAGTGVVITHAVQRSARVARLNQQVQRMLSPGHQPAVEAARTLTTPSSLDAGDELAGLRQALGQLGERMAGQIKETAKKSRNLETLVDTLADPLVVTDQHDEVLLCNAAAERFFAAPRTTLVGRPIRGLFTRREVLSLHARAHAGESCNARVSLTGPSGVRTYDVTAAPLPAAWGTGVFGALLFLRDITELAQAVQMQTDFVANASHELRTPIAAIRAATETLQDGAVDDPPMRDKLLRTIDNHAHRLEEMVRDLLDLSRLESPGLSTRLAPLAWGELVATMRQTFDPLCAPRSLKLELSLDPAVEGFVSDPRLVGLVLRNFIDNAAKYAREQTTISVRIARVAPSGAVRLEVADRGVGIPLAHQERVWERFYQVDPARTGFTSRRGTGLGLAIVKHAVTALGGQVGIASVWGEGTTVWAELPWRESVAEERPPAGEGPVSPPRG